jgi:hypothetical protein
MQRGSRINSMICKNFNIKSRDHTHFKIPLTISGVNADIMIRIFLALFLVLLCGLAGDVMAKPSRLRVADRQEQKIPLPAPAADSCRPAVWKSVSPDVVSQAAELIRQYNAAADQLAKLGTEGPTTVMVVRPLRPGWPINPSSSVYQGDWNEVREALQGMLSKRISGLACKLQVLGVDMGHKASI